MIVEWYKKKSALQGQRIVAKTILFEKSYFWMQDHDGTTYLLPEKDGRPVFA